MKLYFDSFGNAAMITTGRGYPYKGAPEKVTEFCLSLFATYDGNKLYHYSIYETAGDAEAALREFSAGTFKPAT